MTRRTPHAFVLGSGIAGLSLAEILSRNGWRITLLDSACELGGDASRATQNWLHTGWLYAALPNSSAMEGCHRALQLFHSMYDAVLGPDTVNVSIGPRGVAYPRSSGGWFSPDRVQYLYALSTSDLSAWQRIFWRHYLEAIPWRRLRALGYSTEISREISPRLRDLLDFWEESPTGHSAYAVIPSTDAQIHTRRVLNSLLALLGERAEVVREANYVLTSHGDVSSVSINGETHTPDLLVIASGKSIPQQLRQLGRGAMADAFKSICSPVVVLKRLLDLPSFIRFTPHLPSTVNHIRYDAGEIGSFSTLGSHEYYPASEAPDISRFADRICKRLGIPPSDVVDRYYGTKTEFTGAAERRYNHAVERVNANSYFAIPGKFSQFPLLVHDFAAKLGLRADVTNEARGLLAMKVSATAPERIAGSLAKSACANPA